jgi:hypothetical protein
MPVWSIDDDQQVYIRRGRLPQMPAGNEWKQVEGRLAEVSVGHYEVWAVTDDSRIYRRTDVAPSTPEGSGWQRMPGYLESVSCGPAGTVGLASWGGIFTWTGSDWERIPGYLSQVSVGQGGMWGLADWGGIFYRPSVAADGTPWQRMPGYLDQVTAGPGGDAWGLTNWGGIFYWDGTDWTRVSGHLAQINAGSGETWGVSDTGVVFRRTGVTASAPAGAGWESVSGGERMQVAVGMEDAPTALALQPGLAPVAEAGPDLSVAPGQQFTLSAYASYDEDGKIVLYEWDLDGDGTFETEGAEPTTTLWTEGVSTMALRVTDDSAMSDTDTCTATVTASQ